MRTGVHVDRVRATAGESGFVVTAGDRVLEADQVILATGAFHNPSVPAPDSFLLFEWLLRAIAAGHPGRMSSTALGGGRRRSVDSWRG